MNKMIHAGLTMAVIALAGVVTNASAQEKTRAEVRQELIQAENNGSRFVTDSSYPDINPIFVQQAARVRAQHSGDSDVGAAMVGSSETGHTSSMACVGPEGFCKPYFGS
jgi:Na+-translocating ferredoxin:NAD+ oxidoreductase RnfG subunit